jgi:predicted membrane-bound spermidine synthase
LTLQGHGMDSGRTTLYAMVAIVGAATMGVEMSASRLLAPYFGNSLPVWGVLIGLLLAYLAIGYALGGRLADRHPHDSVLYRVAAWSGFLVGLVPYLSRPILHLAASAFARYETGAVLGSLLGVLALFAAPVAMLGCISPFAIRLSVESRNSSGDVAGRIYALSTLGSLVGTFGTVFGLIPALGTQRTFFVLSIALLGTALVGLAQACRQRALPYLLLLVVIVALQFVPTGPVKPTPGLIHELDSTYNYIQVLREGESLVLKLNEGEGIQSAYRPGQVLTGYVYDYFLLVPFFRSEALSPVANLCLIGLAAGTTARQYSAVFGPIPIHGVEIDPAIVDVARQFFDLNLPNLTVIIEDGRYYLANSDQRYDVIAVDAYRPPYIPFQLTTVEFFAQVYDHLTHDGVVAVNVARTETDYALVDAIAGTMKAAYPNVYVLDIMGNLNSIVVATKQPTDLRVVEERLAALSDPVLLDVVQRASGRVWEFREPVATVLRDDHAPVEQIVHAIAARYLFGGQSGPAPEELP